MGVINSIRQRSGLLLTIVLVGIVLFILGDFISGQLRGKTEQNFVGEVDGEEISAAVFAKELEEVENTFARNTGRRPQEREKQQLKQQVWNQLLFKTIYADEFDKLGITITRISDGDDNEEYDMLAGGRTMDDNIKNVQTFKNQRGEFDINLFNRYLNMIENPQNQEQQSMKEQWISYSKMIYEQRLRNKYTSLLSKSTYITTAEAKREYEALEKTGTFDYVHIPSSSVVDSLITVSDDELEDYLDEHEKEFTVSESRVIDYVSFPIVSNKADEERTKKEIESLAKQFQSPSNDSTFAKAKTDIGTKATAKYVMNELPLFLLDKDFVKNEVYGPYLESNDYKLYKYLGDVKDTSYVNPSASHILFTTQGLDDATKEAKRQQAKEVLARAIAGEDFMVLAFQFSEDNGSKQKGGDLGSFGKGSMVKPFEDAVFGAKREGVVPRLIETQFGYHIINVTGLASVADVLDKKLFAQITKKITAGRDTRNTIFREVNTFLKEAKEDGDFDRALENNKSRAKVEGVKLSSRSKFVNDLGEATSLVNWAYRQDESDVVSDLIKMTDKYVVAIVTKVIKENDLTVENLREQLKDKVVLEKKLQLIKDKLSEYTGSIVEIKDAYNNAHGTDVASVYENVSLTFSNPMLGTTGFDPVAVGAAFSVAQGEQSSVVIGENAAYVFKTISINEPSEIADYSEYQKKLSDPQAGSIDYKADQALRKLMNFEDKSYLLF